MDLNEALGSLDTFGGVPSAACGKTPGDDRSRTGRDGDPIETSTASPLARPDVREDTGSPSLSPATVPVPASPSLSKCPRPLFISSVATCKFTIRGKLHAFACNLMMNCIISAVDGATQEKIRRQC